MGVDRALSGLHEWPPDLLFSHGLLDPEIEARTLHIAPAVFLAHAYYGTCISGAKMFKSPTNTPCSRTFGWPCLVNYYPRRCGGWSPITMVRDFRHQGQRLELLSRYKAIVTLSSHSGSTRVMVSEPPGSGRSERGVSSATDSPRRGHDDIASCSSDEWIVSRRRLPARGAARVVSGLSEPP
jgi:hypothetical protein